MSVAIAITITLPNTTAAAVKCTGTDIQNVLGPAVAMLVQNEIDNTVKKELQGVATWTATVT